VPGAPRVPLRFTMRPPSSGSEDFDRRNLLLVRTWRDSDDRVCAEGYVGRGHWWMRWPDVATFRCNRAGAVDATPNVGINPDRVDDLYQRTVQPLALQALGWEVLHASAVRFGEGVVAFCGERGAGKSTIAYALAARGHPQAADDTLVFEPPPGAVGALLLPFQPRLRPESAALLRPQDQDEPATQTGWPSPATVPLTTIVVLARSEEGEPVMSRLEGGAAFAAILAHAHCFDPDDPATRRRVLENYLEVAAKVPVYSLRFAPGLGALPRMLDSIETATGAPAVAGFVA
jgi:hypothetical protein